MIKKYKIEFLEMSALVFIGLFPPFMIFSQFYKSKILLWSGLLLIICGLIILAYIPSCYRKKEYTSLYERVIYSMYAKKNTIFTKAYTKVIESDDKYRLYYETMIKYLVEEEVYKELIKDDKYNTLEISKKYKVLNKIFFNNNFVLKIKSESSKEDRYLKKMIVSLSKTYEEKYNERNLNYLGLKVYWDKFQEAYKES